MARKHEKFSFTYGWKTAPESYKFYLNGKIINLDFNTCNRLGYMCCCGKVKEAENELKRFLRKEEKRSAICGKCIAFYELDGNKYFYSRDCVYKSGNLAEALRMYKEWKRYIQERDNKIAAPVRITTGFITPYGVMKGEDITEEYIVDLSRKRIITIIRNPRNVMFPFLLKSYRREKEGKI